MNHSFDEAARRLPRHQLTDEEKQEQLRRLRDAIAADSRASRRPARRWRRLTIIACGAICATAAGVGTAAAFGAFSARPADRWIAHCYTTAEVNDPTNHEDITVALPPSQKNPSEHDAAASALDLCAGGWQQGRYSTTDPNITIAPKPPPWTYPIPPLVACVLPSGQVGVFPGTADTCATLGLPQAET